LFAKIAMVIWFQVSGFSMHLALMKDSTFTPFTAIPSANFQQRYRSGTFLSNVFYKSFNIQIFIDLKIPYVHKIAMGHLISSLTLTPDT